MLKTPPRRSAGFSLVELMIGVAIGLVLLIGLSSVYVSSVRGGRTTTAANQLNQEMRALMDIMVNDIRRAGYWAGAETRKAQSIHRGGHVACDFIWCAHRILYSYDAVDLGGAPNVVDAQDHFGFQLAGGGVVQAAVPGSVTSTAIPCANANWMDLTDSVATEVTQLTFDTVGLQVLRDRGRHPGERSSTGPLRRRAGRGLRRRSIERAVRPTRAIPRTALSKRAG